MKLQLAVLLAGVALAVAGPLHEPSRDTHGAQVLRVKVTDLADLRYLAYLQSRTTLDFWTEPRALGEIDIMARRWDLPMLKAALQHRNLQYSVQIANVHRHLADLKERHLQARTKAGDSRMSWDAYYNYDEINAWLDSLAAEYPSIATVTDVGTSYEGRTMKLLKLSTGGTGKDAIFTDGGIHAREWIAPATVTYFIQQLVAGDGVGLLDSVDFYFMPAINPDGYAYTFTDVSPKFCHHAVHHAFHQSLWTLADSLANAAVAALTAVHGTQYKVGSSTNTIYIAAGGSDDWALGVGGSEYAYTIELRDEGQYGFRLPESLIIPTAEETWAGFKVVAQFIADNPKPK
ncbi:carboxypeptidase B-like [Hyalella azteca]|uniref:Carboxypeptidase B-like n=1 Tax=Hyalella azteca TaxID=294128 RepID=A0A979FF65_HYAAZ|nr:carboxypeptidase B-like [Hyalella azteca]